MKVNSGGTVKSDVFALPTDQVFSLEQSFPAVLHSSHQHYPNIFFSSTRRDSQNATAIFFVTGLGEQVLKCTITVFIRAPYSELSVQHFRHSSARVNPHDEPSHPGYSAQFSNSHASGHDSGGCKFNLPTRL